jgi:protein tyrosine/serine phosphatase
MRSLGDILYNFHWVLPAEAARMAQPWAGGTGPFLQKHGIKALINLRGRNDDLNWWKKETAALKARGIAHFDAMLDSRRLPTREMLAQLLPAFAAAPRPLVVKCSGGQDRTSLAMAIYLLHRDGWTALDAARAQFSRFPYLHFPKRHQRWLSRFLDFAAEEAQGAPIADWITQDYSPERLKAWLDMRGENDFYAAIFTVPTRSPFQW